MLKHNAVYEESTADIPICTLMTMAMNRSDEQPATQSWTGTLEQKNKNNFLKIHEEAY